MIICITVWIFKRCNHFGIRSIPSEWYRSNSRQIPPKTRAVTSRSIKSRVDGLEMISREWMAEIVPVSSLYHQLAHLSCKKNGNFLHSIPRWLEVGSKVCLNVSLLTPLRAHCLIPLGRSIRTLCTHEIQEVRMRFYAVARLKRPQCFVGVCWLVSFLARHAIGFVFFFFGGHIYTPENSHGKPQKWRLNLNMEPQNEGFRRCFSFPNGWFSGSMLVFGGESKGTTPPMPIHKKWLASFRWW